MKGNMFIMYIKKIHQELKDTTITLRYGEVEELSNILYEASFKKDQYSDNVKHLYKDFYILSRLLKDGCLDVWDIEHMNKIVNETEEEEDE